MRASRLCADPNCKLRRYTQMNSKVGFWLHQFGGKFSALTRALALGNGHSFRTQKFTPLLCQIPNF